MLFHVSHTQMAFIYHGFMDDLFNDIIDDSQSLKVGGLCYHFWNIFSKCLLTSFNFEMTPQILINLKSKKYQQYMFRGIIPPCQLFHLVNCWDSRGLDPFSCVSIW